MKKTLKAIICLALCSVMLFSLIACGGNKKVIICYICGYENTSSTKFCSNCGAKFGKETTPVQTSSNDTPPPVSSGSVTTEHSHSFSEANCTDPAKCDCGTTSGTSLGHNWSNATCTASKKCSRCGATDGSPLGHNWSDATCTASEKCSRCGTTNGTPLGHSWSGATCTVGRKCANCGKTDGNPLGHDWGSATCSDAAKCNRCGTSSGGALGHDWLSATCTEPSKCSRCKITNGAPNGHSYTSVVTKPTCTQQGYTTHTCHCGYSYKDSYKTPSHNYVNYKCNGCGLVDKTHALEYITMWLKKNGTDDGDYIGIAEYYDNERYELYYSKNNGTIAVSSYRIYDNTSTFTAIYLEDYYYGFSYDSDYNSDDTEMRGYISASRFDENYQVSYTNYSGPTDYEGKELILEFAKYSLLNTVDWLSYMLSAYDTGITVSDLGFTAYNY